MKNILVLMHDDVGQEARFQAALDITRALDGHLTCVDVAAPPVTVADYATLGGSALLLADEQANEADNRARMEQRLKIEGVSWDWIQTTGFLSPSVREAAGLADVIVLNRDIKNAYPDMAEVAAEVLIKSDRPVVAVPHESRGFDAFGHAMVAWDGSAEAQTALRAAVPLLQHACKVTIIECADGSIKVPAEEAAAYLSRHGVNPAIWRAGTASDLPSTILLDQIEAQGVAYLVMGGFGHSRFTEAVLGGVTRRMLRECPVPLFLAH
ncbi:universal stress protein [Sphingomonas psychrotolerans]|uniref:Universal stress protein n=1 Tax=Sphingomonas psychrotolerans TaxID=1327635 RepID=A0ABU3N2H2_9SPHN|nr:universal stress protein [Sphingomonas psychrotolerans]MDT8758466.1 universal stress protein [Sphingomonas psychrotolerans]